MCFISSVSFFQKKLLQIINLYFFKKYPHILLIILCFFSFSKILYANQGKVVSSETAKLVLRNNVKPTQRLELFQKNKVDKDTATLLKRLSGSNSLGSLVFHNKSAVLNEISDEGDVFQISGKKVNIRAPLVIFTEKNIINNGQITNELPTNFSSEKKLNTSTNKGKKVIVDSNGLTAQFISLLSNWKNNAHVQLKKIGNAIVTLPQIIINWKNLFNTPQKIRRIGIYAFYFFLFTSASWIAEWRSFIAMRRKWDRILQKISHWEEGPNSKNSVLKEWSNDNSDILHKKEKIFFKISRILCKERRIKQLLYSLDRLVFDSIPLLIFYVISALGLVLITSKLPELKPYFATFVKAYFYARLICVLSKSILSPDLQSLRLIEFSNDVAGLIYRWICRLTIVLTFAYLGNEFADIYQISEDFRLAWIKLFGLIFHVSLLIIVFQTKNSIKSILYNSSSNFIGTVRKGILAKIWTWMASGLIVVIWVLWTFGLEDGLQRIIYFFLRTILLLISAHLLLLFINGLLSAFLNVSNYSVVDTLAKDENQNSSRNKFDGAGKHIFYQTRLHFILKYAAFFIVIVGDALFLLDAWDFKIIDWLSYNPTGRGIAGAISTIFISIIFALFIWNLVNLIIEKRLRKWQKIGDSVRVSRVCTLLPMLRMLLITIISLLLGLTILKELGIDTTPLLAGASLIGVAIGFGSQKLVQDFVTGIFLLMENAIQVGDLITVAGVTGIVEQLSIRAVRVRSPDGSLNTVPFSSVTIVNNVNRGIANALFRVALAHPVDVDKVKEIFIKIVKEMREEAPFDRLILDNLDWWGVDTINGASVTVVAQLRTVDDARLKVQREFNLRLVEYLKKEKIELDNPQSYIFKKSTIA